MINFILLFSYTMNAQYDYGVEYTDATNSFIYTDNQVVVRFTPSNSYNNDGFVTFRPINNTSAKEDLLITLVDEWGSNTPFRNEPIVENEYQITDKGIAINISCKNMDVTYRILNMMGAVVLQGSAVDGKIVFLKSNFAKGLYVIHISNI